MEKALLASILSHTAWNKNIITHSVEQVYYHTQLGSWNKYIITNSVEQVYYHEQRGTSKLLRQRKPRKYPDSVEQVYDFDH